MKKKRKKMRKNERAERAALALDLLYNYYDDDFAKHLMMTLPYEELIDFTIEYYKKLEQQTTFVDLGPLSELTQEQIREIYYDNEEDPEYEGERRHKGTFNFVPIDEPDGFEDDFDIPDEYWKEFKAYGKKHKKARKRLGMIKFRKKFKRHIMKKRKKHLKKATLYDPLFKYQQLKRKEMKKNLKRINEENKCRSEEFAKLMNELVGDTYKVDQAQLKSFKARSEEVMKRVRKQMKDALKSAPKTPLPFSIS